MSRQDQETLGRLNALLEALRIERERLLIEDYGDQVVRSVEDAIAAVEHAIEAFA